MKKRNVFILSIILTLAAGGISAWLSGNMTSFEQIRKPFLTPPSALFPIVWTVLYVLMAVGVSIIITSGGDDNEKGLCITIYVIQLLFNFMWSIWFFKINAFLFAFIWFCIMLGFIIAMTVCFLKISKIAAYIQIPYIIWTAFAGYLNFAVYLIN